MSYRKYFNIAVILVFISQVNAQSYQWGKRIYNVTSPGTEVANDVVSDNSGNTYSVGHFQWTVDFNPGSSTFNLSSMGSADVFIIKLSPNGNFIWAKKVGGTGYDRALSVALDDFGNVYVAGIFTGAVDFDPGSGTYNLTSNGNLDAFVFKLDMNGNFLWANSWGGSGDDYANSVYVSSNNESYVTGYYVGSVDFNLVAGVETHSSNSGSSDIYLLKINSGGGMLFCKSVGGSSIDGGVSVKTDENGGVYVCGVFQNNVDFDPGSGTSNLFSLVDSGFLLKLNAQGIFEWVKPTGTFPAIYSWIYAKDMDIDDAGNTFVTGTFDGVIHFNVLGTGDTTLTAVGMSSDSFILKFNPSGDLIWVRQLLGTNSNSGGQYECDSRRIRVDAIGDVLVSVDVDGTTDFDPGPNNFSFTTPTINPVVLKLNSSGDFVWAKQIISSGVAYINGISTDLANNVYLAGGYTGLTDFNPGTNTDSYVSSGYDVDVIKLGPCPSILEVQYASDCTDFTWINGVTYNSSNSSAKVYYNTANGCDSIVQLNFTILSNSGIDIQHQCEPFVWIDGITYSSSNNTATYTLTNVNGCDSVVYLDLTIGPFEFTDYIISCDPITWIDGNTYFTSNNSALFTYTAANGCDSIIYLDYIRNTVNTTVNQIDPISLMSIVPNAIYQWLDCVNGYAQIIGENGQNFVASENGIYALQIIENGCVDTSVCFSIQSVGLPEFPFYESLIYPNPFYENFTFLIPPDLNEFEILIFDIQGKLIWSEKRTEVDKVIVDIPMKAGVYRIGIKNEERITFSKIVKL